MVAQVGQAIPRSKSQSWAGGSSEKVTTLVQTFSGGAFTITSERTAKRGGLGKGFFFKAHEEKSGEEEGERGVVAECPVLNQVAHPASHGSQGQGNGSGHEQAEDSFDCQSKQKEEGKGEG